MLPVGAPNGIPVVRSLLTAASILCGAAAIWRYVVLKLPLTPLLLAITSVAAYALRQRFPKETPPPPTDSTEPPSLLLTPEQAQGDLDWAAKTAQNQQREEVDDSDWEKKMLRNMENVQVTVESNLAITVATIPLFLPRVQTVLDPTQTIFDKSRKRCDAWYARNNGFAIATGHGSPETAADIVAKLEEVLACHIPPSTQEDHEYVNGLRAAFHALTSPHASLVLCLIRDRTAWIASVGESRAIFVPFEGDPPTQLCPRDPFFSIAKYKIRLEHPGYIILGSPGLCPPSSRQIATHIQEMRRKGQQDPMIAQGIVTNIHQMGGRVDPTVLMIRLGKILETAPGETREPLPGFPSYHT